MRKILKLFLLVLVMYWVVALLYEELKPMNKRPEIVIIEGGRYDKK